MNKKKMIYLALFIHPFFMYSQSIVNNEKYIQFSLPLIVNEMSIKTNTSNDKTILSSSDKYSIDVIIPIFMLNDSIKSDYSKFLKLINFKQNEHSQIALFESNCIYYGMFIYKGIRDVFNERRLKGEALISPDNDGLYIQPDFDEKYFDYFKLKNYIKSNPTIQLFSIFRIKGLWAIRNGELIRLVFHKRKGIVEINGENYYNKVLIKDGLDGIERVIHGAFFEQLLYK